MRDICICDFSQWDSVVYTAPPPPPHDGPHPPGNPGGPACRGGQGALPRNGKIFIIHWRIQRDPD